MWRKRELSCTLGGNVNCCRHWEIQQKSRETPLLWRSKLCLLKFSPQTYEVDISAPIDTWRNWGMGERWLFWGHTRTVLKHQARGHAQVFIVSSGAGVQYGSWPLGEALPNLGLEIWHANVITVNRIPLFAVDSAYWSDLQLEMSRTTYAG